MTDSNHYHYTKNIPVLLIYLAPILCLLLLFFVLNETNPLQTGPASILVVLVALYLLIFTTLAAILHVVGAVWRMLHPQRPLSLHKGYYVLSVLAMAPVLMVALNTLGQLGALEFILIIVLIALACFYVLRRGAK